MSPGRRAFLRLVAALAATLGLPGRVAALAATLGLPGRVAAGESSSTGAVAASREVGLYLCLMSTLTGRQKTDPKIEEGDVRVSRDFGPLVNIGTLPEVSPGGLLRLELSLGELGEEVTAIVLRDLTEPKEWHDFVLEIITPEQVANRRRRARGFPGAGRQTGAN